MNSFIVLICLGVDTMAPKDVMKRMKAEHNKKRKLQITTDRTPPNTVSNRAPSLECKNVPCKSKYSVVPTIFSPYPRIAVSIIVIILHLNQKPYFVDRAI